MKVIWDSIKEVRTIGGVLIAILIAITYFSGQYDNIRLLEYWTLFVLCAACSLYVVKNRRDEHAKNILILIFIGAALALCAIIFRQHQRYNDYEISWDIGYSNTSSDLGNRAVQVGLCIVNPNNFTVYAKVPSVSVNIDSSSGSFANEDKDRVYPITAYSSSAVQYSNYIPIGGPDSGPHKGVIQADIQYGRSPDKLDKHLPVSANPQYAQNELGDVVGVWFDPKTTDIPHSYDLLEPMRESKCRRFKG